MEEYKKHWLDHWENKAVSALLTSCCVVLAVTNWFLWKSVSLFKIELALVGNLYGLFQLQGVTIWDMT